MRKSGGNYHGEPCNNECKWRITICLSPTYKFPPSAGNELFGELQHKNLADCDSDGSLSLQALSYVWGSDKKPFEIVTSSGSLPPTASLHSLPKRIRRPCESLLLWTDAVCIRQAVISENENQISMISLIYSRAQLVVADLEGEEEDSRLVIDSMDQYWRISIW
jgi:hypothetical protein